MSHCVCHLSVGRTNLDERIPGMQLSGYGKSCDRKVLYIQVAIAWMEVGEKQKRLIPPCHLSV
jgi:hypothetical protein